MHEQTKRRPAQRIGVRPAEQMPSRTRPATPNPSVSVKSRNAIGHALFHERISVFVGAGLRTLIFSKRMALRRGCAGLSLLTEATGSQTLTGSQTPEATGPRQLTESQKATGSHNLTRFQPLAVPAHSLPRSPPPHPL